MKIAVIAGKTRVKEWLPSKLPSRWECVWGDDVADLEQHGDADVFMDLAFTADEARVRQLSGLLPAPVMINSMVDTLQDIGQPFIRINAWPGMLERNIHELAMTAPLQEKVDGAGAETPDCFSCASPRSAIWRRDRI